MNIQRHKIMAAGYVFSMLLIATAAHAQEVLRMGYFAIPPHVVQLEGDEPGGAAVDYFNKFIAPNMDIAVSWDVKAIAPTRLMGQLQTGEKDAMIFLGYTEARTEYLHYPDPYLIVPETLAFLTDRPTDQINEVSDLYGMKIGFLVGGRIPEALQDEKIEYDLIAGKRLFERNVEKLLTGRIDAVYAPLSTALASIIKQMDVTDKVKLVPLDFLEPVQIYTVFSRDTVNESVVSSYNEALKIAKREINYIDYIDQIQSEP